MDVEIAFPGVGSLKGKWEADEAQKLAAWEMYVEIVTRIAVIRLKDDEGVLREALSSLHALFDITRDVLRRGGPGVATPPRREVLSFAVIAVTILNRAIRPFLTKWHPLLLDYEEGRPSNVSRVEWERRWPQASNARAELKPLQKTMQAYADLLAIAAGVESVLDDRDR